MKNKKRILGWFILIMITVTNIIICCLNYNRAANTDNRETVKDTEQQKPEDYPAESEPSDESEESSIEADKADAALREQLVQEGYLVEDKADAALREQLVKEGYLVESDWMIMEENLELPYADAEAFQFIKDAYAPIEFGGDITSGDPAFYDEYIEIFKQLMYNRAPFTDRETGEEIFLKDFDGLKFDWEKNYYVYSYVYHFFDADGDGRPELGIRNEQEYNEEYIFQYLPEKEQFILWYTMKNGHYEMTGPKKMQWIAYHHLAFYQLDDDGETECHTFFTNGNYNREVGPYLVMLPIYADRELETDVPEEIKRQGIFEIYQKQWFFRVTEEQYEEITAPYWEAYFQVQEEMEKVTYTYEELFED